MIELVALDFAILHRLVGTDGASFFLFLFNADSRRRVLLMQHLVLIKTEAVRGKVAAVAALN